MATRMATVQGILSDVNIRGHVDFLVTLIQSGSWKSIWREQVIESLLDILLDIDAYRGTGRLYLP